MVSKDRRVHRRKQRPTTKAIPFRFSGEVWS
ncbi:hypothetical protein LINGRAHAP2_LOCUS27828 [Linum grandiflorum]